MTEMRAHGTTCSSDAMSTPGRASAWSSLLLLLPPPPPAEPSATSPGGGLDSTAHCSVVDRTSVAYIHHALIHAAPIVHVNIRLKASTENSESPTLTENDETKGGALPGLPSVRSV